MRHAIVRTALVLAVVAAFAAPAFADGPNISKVNKSIRVEANDTAGDVETVNGGIRLGENATARGVETVNGSVRLERGAHAETVETVNGGITLYEGATVAGDVEAVNGSIELESQAEVVGGVSNVNGVIELRRAQVGGGIETTSGDIYVLDGSRVGRGIHVEEPRGWYNNNQRDPRIVIGAGAVVEGDLVFDRKVDLYVHESARVGNIRGATAQRYAGNTPGFD